jgi:hypothetical protein
MSNHDIAVSVRGLSKAYTIAHNDERHVTLAEQMLHRLRNPFQRAQTETLGVLKAVQFDVKKRDVVNAAATNQQNASFSEITLASTNDDRFHFIDGLRGIASLSVVIYHLWFNAGLRIALLPFCAVTFDRFLMSLGRGVDVSSSSADS